VQYRVIPFELFVGALPSVQRKPSVAVLLAVGLADATPAFQTNFDPFFTHVNVLSAKLTF
jgi:hypothetical protein